MAKPFKDIAEVPFPRQWPLGHTKAFAGSTLGFVEGCIAAGLHMGRARIAFKDFVFLLHPELVRQVMQRKHRSYHKSFAYEGLRHFLGDGLLTSEGDHWLRQRRAIQPGFHREALAGMRQQMQACAHEFVEKCLAGRAAGSLQAMMLDLTRRITADCLFGPGLLDEDKARKLDEGLAQLRQYANDRLKNPFLPPRWVPVAANRRLKSGIRLLQEIVGPIIAQKQRRGGEGDLLDMMLAQTGPGKAMEMATLYDEIVTLFVAGQETTTNALAFALYLLGEHPEEMERLRAAYEKDAGQGEAHLEAVVKESLRLYPPAWAVSRVAIAGEELDGHEVPAGKTVFLSIYAMQRHPDYWEAPEAFLPGRWLDMAGRPEAYMPFGMGPRICVGEHFALMEMQEVLREIILHLDWAFPPDQNWDLVTPMTLGFKHPVRIAWRKR